MMMNKAICSAVLLACVVASGCASQTRTEREFGDSVRAVTSNQVYDKVAAVTPSTEAVTGGQPDQLEAVMTTHQENVSNAQQVQRPINMGIGSGN